MNLEDECPDCDGTGKELPDHKTPCGKCGASGKIASAFGEELLQFLAAHIERHPMSEFARALRSISGDPLDDSWA